MLWNHQLERWYIRSSISAFILNKQGVCCFSPEESRHAVKHILASTYVNPLNHSQKAEKLFLYYVWELTCPKYLQPSKITYLFRGAIWLLTATFHAWVQNLNKTWYQSQCNNISIHETNPNFAMFWAEETVSFISFESIKILINTSGRIYEKIRWKNEACNLSTVMCHRKVHHF